MPDGSPQNTPVWFDYVDGKIRVNSALGRTKVRNMKLGAKVALSISDPRQSRSLRPAALHRYRCPPGRGRRSAYRSARVQVHGTREESGYHHLAEPEAAFRQLTRAVKPGGHVLIWVYGRENMSWLTRYFDPIRRSLLCSVALTARLSSFALSNSCLVAWIAHGDVTLGILQITSWLAIRN